jgi:hypothetical protein
LSTRTNLRLPRHLVRAADIQQIRERVELDVDGLDLPVTLFLGRAEDGDAADLLLGDAERGLPDQRDLVARGGGFVRDFQGYVVGLLFRGGSWLVVWVDGQEGRGEGEERT